MDKKKARIGALLVALGGLLLLISARMNWLEVAVYDDKSGAALIEMPGSAWSTETTALALMLLAGAVAALALRRLARRVVAVLSAIAAAGASWAPLTLLAGEPDPQRVHNLLTTGAASQRANDPVSISQWAVIDGINVASAGPILAMLGSAVALFGAVLIVVRPGTDGAKMNKYERAEARREKLADDLENDPDSGRVMWDALDEDIDPTEKP